MLDAHLAIQMAEARRQHWLTELENASRAGNEQAATVAKGHVDEYDALIVELKRPLPASISCPTERNKSAEGARALSQHGDTNSPDP